MTTEAYYEVLDRYNDVEPLESWLTADLVTMIRLMDAELQRRHHENDGLNAALSLHNEGGNDDTD